jgi:hypothetical protein
MRFYTKDECEEWLRGRDRVPPDQTAGIAVERIGYPPEPHKFFYFAHWIATSLTYRMPALLWITEWSIWSSSENWHLYYRLRQKLAVSRRCERHLAVGTWQRVVPGFPAHVLNWRNIRITLIVEE